MGLGAAGDDGTPADGGAALGDCDPAELDEGAAAALGALEPLAEVVGSVDPPATGGLPAAPDDGPVPEPAGEALL